MKGKIEIMAPAGNFKSLAAAINSGADSVYFGVGNLNMRARGAMNFTEKDLGKISKLCKEKNVKTYLTVNIVFYDSEISQMKKLIDSAKKSGIDAVIAHDMSVLEYANSIGMPIHISTQANISNTEAVKYYSKFADVVVLARELTLDQIKKISDEITSEKIKGPSGELVKIEAFVHGALCVSISGKCYMSLAKYNHSANRGDCFQVCRRGYTVRDNEDDSELKIENQYIMSPKDLCTISGIDKLISSGVQVFKIEGRGRGEEYVATTVKVYKEAVESVAKGEYTDDKIQKWKTKLNEVFNRGFWEGGYYLGEKTESWSGAYGSQATKQKFYLGKTQHFYPKTKIGEFLIEAGDHKLKVGDEILISGKLTGVVEGKVEQIFIHNGDEKKETSEAGKGDLITFKVPSQIRKGDELYLWSERKISQSDAIKPKEELHILLFYKFVNIENPEKTKKEILEYCQSNNLLGRILVGEEGINGSVSGNAKQTESFKKFMHSKEKFSDLRFKDDIGLEHPFSKMRVLIKKEIVALGVPVNLSNGGEYISPEKLEETYKKEKVGKDFIMLDTRNDYEFKVGHFKNSEHLNIKTFRQFPEAVKNSEKLAKFKDKKVIMCCTGGIRCEKASAFMKENGFKNVYQLHDGIINFGKKLPESELWEGKNFVFDKRLVAPISEVGGSKEALTKCELCGKLSDLYRNCRNTDCDKLFTACKKCQQDYNGCCSVDCFKEFKIQCENKSARKQGRRQEVVLN